MKNAGILIVIVGPTAVGKTEMGIQIAKYLHTEIVSADSRQVFKEMNIGTAKPSNKELIEVKHHLINTHSIDELFDAGAFADKADPIVNGLIEKNGSAVMVGGSGLYVKAFCEGLDQMPRVDVALRGQLNNELAENGLPFLLEELKQKDLAYYETVDRNNPQRVIRALEVIRTTNEPYSKFRLTKIKKSHPYKIIKIGLEMDRALLYKRIDDRMDAMISQGIFDEAKALYPHRLLNALQTVGYQEIFGFIDGQYDREEAVRLLKRNSRRYAKRQMTWFKRDEEVAWFSPKDCEKIMNYIKQEA